MSNRNKLETLIWCFKTAYNIKPSFFIGGILIVFFLSSFPSLTILIQQRIFRALSDKYDTSNYYLVSLIFVFVLLLIISNIASNLNSDFIGELVYDYYNVGMEQMVIDVISKVPIEKFFDQDFSNKYRYLKYKYTALPNFISTFWVLCLNFVGCIFVVLIIGKQSIFLFVISLIYIIITIIVSNKINGRIKFDYIKYRECESQVRYIEDNVNNIDVAKEIRINSIAINMRELWNSAYAPIEFMERKIGKWRSISDIINVSLYLGIFLFYVLYFYEKMKNREFHTDNFLTLILALQTLSSSVRIFLLNYEIAMRNYYDLCEVKLILDEIIDKKQEKRNISKAKEKFTDPYAFTLENVSFSYLNNKNVINNITANIQANKITAILGLNGSGKSTLIKLLLGIYTEYKGEIKCFGNKYNYIGEMQSYIGVFLQNGNMFHDRISSNIGFGDIRFFANRNLIMEAAKKGGISDYENIENSWILKDVRSDGIYLSGGQNERILLARAYMGEKKVYIFDEPGIALDAQSEYKLYEGILENKKNTIILVSHKVGFAQYADEIILLDKGNIVGMGTHKELMNTNELYKKLYYEQAKWYKGRE